MSADNYFNRRDAIVEFFLKILSRPNFPRWGMAPPLPLTKAIDKDEPLLLEIVTHCWKYSELLNCQLTSLYENPPQSIKVIMTVFYSEEDIKTTELLTRFEKLTPKNVQWRWWALPKTHLFRRSIGRNLAALESKADWLWFTDCDVLFRGQCFNQLATCLSKTQANLVYPKIEFRSDALPKTNVLESKSATAGHINFQEMPFIATPLTRATGPMQITRGDIARQIGYCRNIRIYQKPARHWCKASEDRVFRWLLSSQGEAIEVDGVCRIQHQDKGRYNPKGKTNRLRNGFQNFKLRVWKWRFE